ncbi:MAG: DUF1223 domain-containing protein [Candidatus Acidiferrales bacterium]
MRIFLAGVALVTVCGVCGLQTKAQAPAVKMGRAPVVVELFTSEGCSDCPPAEALALKLEQQPIAGADVIVLEEHVDYWNRQGWIDPFSSMEWTERQQNYVSKLGNGNPYTPEMVVDGQSQFVGSNGREALAAIEKAARGVETNVTIGGGKIVAKDSEDFTVSVGKLAGNAGNDVAEVWLAVVEDGLHSSVTRGENAGHVLYHAAVLRSLHKIGVARANGRASFTGNALVKFKSNWKRENLHVVAFVQEKKSRAILGAASTKVTDGLTASD